MEPLTIKVLGEIEVARGAEMLPLPPSKKTRALLAYLVMSGRPHRRERLCEMLWDIPDDPRGALRWSLSRLRPLVDEGEIKRIVANRESVAFAREGAMVDLLELRQRFAEGVEEASLEDLKAAAAAFRGDFLEGLDLADYHEFQAWCVAEREEARVLRARILGQLVTRLPAGDSAAPDHARDWVRADPFNPDARCRLVHILHASGRRREAEQQYEYGVRVLEEAGSEGIGELHRLWRALGDGSILPTATTAAATAERDHVAAAAPPATAAPPAPGQRPAVAVLPFANMGGAVEDEYFADGLTEDIITALAASRLFPVIARNSSFTYKGRNVRIEQAARELGARYMIEGSVRRGGNRIRITVQLVDAETGHHLWAERYDRDLDDIFAVQDEITSRIAAAVEPELAKVEYKRQAARPPRSFAAWELCVRGSAALNLGTPEGNEEAKTMFGQAAELDPHYSHAQAGLAYSYYRDLFLAVAADDDATLAKCREHAERAVALDPSDAFAQGTLGLAHLRAGQFALAEEQGRKAVEINPGRVASYALIGTALTGAGRPLDGIPFLEKCLELNPMDPRNYIYMGFLADACFQASQYAAAIDWAQRSLQQRSTHIEARLLLAAGLGQAGRTEEAAAALEACAALDPGYAESWRRRWAFRSPEDIAHIAGGLKRAGLVDAGGANAGSARPGGLIGRRDELERLAAMQARSTEARVQQIALIKGEPGIGKSHLLREFVEAARRSGATILESSAYEGESGRPYGPWIDALRSVALDSIDPGLASDLSPLLPELRSGTGPEPSRERLFHAVSEVIGAQAGRAPLLVVIFDDVQWFDIASAALLHHVIRDSTEQPVFFVFAAREGELTDNSHLSRVLERLEQEDRLTEIAVGPLGREEIDALSRQIAPQVDGERVFAESAGNPLFALEIARALPGRHGDLPQTLATLVSDRVERLPRETAKVLRWASVIGPVVPRRLLYELAELAPGELAQALENLERHALLRAQTDSGDAVPGRYAFAHDLVRRTIYLTIPEPRRRMLHLRVAETLQSLAGGDDDVAADIARHASRAGEFVVAARACIAAGRRSLRLFANTDAHTLSRRGLHYAEQLTEKDRVELSLELMSISLSARRPDPPDDTIRRIETLAEQALNLGSIDQARLGFQMISELHWEGGNLLSARSTSMRAELITRSGSDAQRATGMAEAAYCLALLERDLGDAEALLAEARALSKRVGSTPIAVPLASGMLRLHQGRIEEAGALLTEAQQLAREAGDHYREFQALVLRFMRELQLGRHDAAAVIGKSLTHLGHRLRDGSEAPFASVLQALADYTVDAPGARDAFDIALGELRNADAKQRLTFALNRAAAIDLSRGHPELAHRRAEEALEHATTMMRNSEIVLARVNLARAATALHLDEVARDHIARLEGTPIADITAEAREALDALYDEVEGLHIDITEGGIRDGIGHC